MPFQSEKQRRYLWANEPKIARDWADTYGSRIEKNDGGIMRVGLKRGGGHSSSSGPAGGASAGGNYGGDSSGGYSDRQRGQQQAAAQVATNTYEDKIVRDFNRQKEIRTQQQDTDHGQFFRDKPIVEKKDDSFFTKLKNKHDLKRRKQYIESYMKKNPHPTGFMWDDWTDEDFLSPENLQLLKGTGYLKNMNQQSGGGDGGYRGYPSYAAWLAAQNRGTGVTEVAEVIEEDVPSNFQPVSMAQLPFPNYPFQAANGGRIPAAYGGIMDSSTGRRAYGLGSIFKSIGRAAKKVFKSPIAKGALMAGLGAYGMGWGPFSGMKGSGFLSNMMSGKLKNRLFMKNLGTWANPDYTGKGAGLSWGKLGLMGAGALPFLLGDQEEDEGSKFDYDAAKNKYRDELMRIKSGAMAGTLDPNKFSYLGVKDGGRIGLYAGGQSTPSDYTMEDAMMTTTQDKLGGITDVMKQADLYRQGSVGQFYAANGGSADDKLMARVKELQDEGLSWDAAWAQAHNELRDKNAQGGRIGYNVGQLVTPGIAGIGRPGYGGDDTYHKILEEEMAKIAEALDIHVSDLSDKDYEKAGDIAYKKYHSGDWGGAQGGRIGAEEGGLMDLGGMEKDYRNDGGFVPLGGEEKADDVPARLSKNEFVFTADAVRGAGGGDIDKGAEIMENIMNNLEQGGQISEETQGLSGAQEMFGVSERLGEVL